MQLHQRSGGETLLEEVGEDDAPKVTRSKHSRWFLFEKKEREEEDTDYLGLPRKELRERIERRTDITVSNLNDLNKDELVQLLLDADEQTSWVQCKPFEVLFMCVVILNACVIGVRIDNPQLCSTWTWNQIDLLFLVIFLVEIVLKLSALGPEVYILDHWNKFDIVVTFLVGVQMSQFYGFSAYSLLPGDWLDTWSFLFPWDVLQILRLCRLLRLARIFKELGMLIESFLMSVKALMWIMVLVLIWFYLAACITTVFVGKRNPLADEDYDTIMLIKGRFKSIRMSMFTLFEIMTLDGWALYVRPFLDSRPLVVAFFFTFLFVSAFFLANLVTAVIVERTVSVQNKMEITEAVQREKNRTSYIKLIRAVLLALNDDQDIIAFPTFVEALENDELVSALESLEWTQKYLISMFRFNDFDSTGKVSINRLHAYLEVSHQPLDTANFLRIHMQLSQRIEYQEKLITVLKEGLEKLGIPSQREGEEILQPPAVTYPRTFDARESFGTDSVGSSASSPGLI